MQEQMLGKSTYVGIGRDRVVRNKRREQRRYGREIEVDLTEHRQGQANTTPAT